MSIHSFAHLLIHDSKMSISHVFFSFWRKVSLPFLAIALLFIYVTLPDSVAIHHNEAGEPDDFMSKQSLFYLFVAVIGVFNLLVVILKNQVKKIDFSKLNIESPWAKSEKLSPIIQAWFDAFVAIINSFLAIVIIAISRINRTEGQRLDINYNWVLIAGAIILMLLFFYLPIRLLFTKPSQE